ncbi:MAG: flagellar basal body P-ring formation chaperone FlgA [Hyphomicrobiaceae bacterium]
MRTLFSAAVFCFVLALTHVGSAGAANVRELITPRMVIYPGDEIGQKMVAKVRFRVSRNYRNAFVDDFSQISNKVARRTLVPGRPIPLSAIRDQYVIERGQVLTLVYRHGALVITGAGIALEPGGLGRMIRVKNRDTGRIVSGTVLADGTVSLGGGR